jgi:WD40 repeat protein
MSMAFSPDGQWLAAPGDGNTVTVRDATTGHEIRTLKGHQTNPVTSVAFSLDGRWLAAAEMDGTVEVWGTATWQEVHTLKGHSAIVWSVAFSPDGQWFAYGSKDQTVKVWDPRPLDAESTNSFDPRQTGISRTMEQEKH